MMEGVYAATDFWWTLEDKYPLAKMFVDGVREEVRLQARMGRGERLHAVRACGPTRSSTPARFYPPDVIKAYEKPAQAFKSMVGEV